MPFVACSGFDDDARVLDRILLGQLAMRDAILGGSVKVSQGTLITVVRFFGYFELPLSAPIELVVR
jgi:hypothetical protein